jgi:hypothetical protein
MEKEAAVEEVKFVVKDALERNGTLDEVSKELHLCSQTAYCIHIHIHILINL